MWLPPAFDSLAPQGFCLTPNLQLFANFFVTHHGCLHTILDHSFPMLYLVGLSHQQHMVMRWQILFWSPAQRGRF
jgi:hypothetical protein